RTSTRRAASWPCARGRWAEPSGARRSVASLEPPARPMPRVTEKMKAPDAAWLRMERPVNPMTITGVMTTAAPMPRETLLRLTEERLLVYRRFRMGIEGADTSSPRWVLEEPFDLGRRIVPLELPAPGDQDALEAAVSALMSEPLAFETAPWTMHHVERYGEGSALIVRL